MVELNSALRKSFAELTKEDCKCITSALVERFKIELNKKDKQGIYAITQRTMAYNSNRIEGSTLTEEQTATLFDTGTLLSDGITVYRAKDIEEMNGHFRMFNYMVRNIDTDLSEDMIKQFHFCLKTGVFEDYANGYKVGDYKTRANRVGVITTALPLEVPRRMAELLQWYQLQGEVKLEDLARFHAEYESIHPFQDGNGRTGRIVLFKQCLDAGFIPVVIRDMDKVLYTSALSKAQLNKDYTQLCEIFLQSQEAYYKELQMFLYDYAYELKELGARSLGVD